MGLFGSKVHLTENVNGLTNGESLCVCVCVREIKAEAYVTKRRCSLCLTRLYLVMVQANDPS